MKEYEIENYVSREQEFVIMKPQMNSNTGKSEICEHWAIYKVSKDCYGAYLRCFEVIIEFYLGWNHKWITLITTFPHGGNLAIYGQWDLRALF